MQSLCAKIFFLEGQHHRPKWASPSCCISLLLSSSSPLPFHPPQKRWVGLPAAVVDQAVRPRIWPKQRSASKSWLVTSSFFFSAPSVAGVRRPAAMASPRERRLPPPAFRMENPFSVKVLQVFTGFGVGCGVGIGVGRPIYLGNEFCRTLSSFLSKE